MRQTLKLPIQVSFEEIANYHSKHKSDQSITSSLKFRTRRKTEHNKTFVRKTVETSNVV